MLSASSKVNGSKRGDVSAERVSLIRRDHVHEHEGSNEARDEGRPRGARHSDPRFKQSGLFGGVKNPRITEQEIENIAAMRTVADEVLRIIALNRSLGAVLHDHSQPGQETLARQCRQR